MVQQNHNENHITHQIELIEIKRKLKEIQKSMLDIDTPAHHNAGGKYFIHNQQIELYAVKYQRPDELSIAGHHEIAHWVWYEKLNGLQKHTYRQIHEQDPVFITEYAKKNVKEDFAESVAHSIKCEFDWSSLSQRRQAFMQEYVEKWY
jgi:predicted SprT family Zn-dependent metalloprotease